MPLSLAEIKQRAIRFSHDWADASRERAEAQTFWNEFFDVFGIRRRTLAAFEEPVRNLHGDAEFIDLFWPGTLIAEHKSRGQNLDKALTQALGYVQNLASQNRADESPRYIVVSDFARLALHDLEDDANSVEIALADLHRHIRAFAFIAGYQSRRLDPEDPANERAVEKLANLHDQLAAARFTGHPLERFLVRILFCLFAEDTGIFDEPEMFTRFLLDHTRADGSDLGPQLSRLFQVLDTARDQRPSNLPEDLAAFPHVNGALFRERLDFPEFSPAQRNALLECARFQWAKISPAVFGSLFQAAMLPKERRQIGAHYTSERDILKLIRSLFLDSLRAEFEACRGDKRKLNAFHDKLAALRFLDPACGCGNFLVITYRELRLLELEVLKALHGTDQPGFNIGSFLRLDVNQLFGIEIEEWPARIAEVALWLLDHQMNQLASETFGNHYVRLPLRATPTIHVGNALRLDWNTVLPAAECSYVMGNPPFVGKQFMTAEQKADMDTVFGDLKGAGVLDYVTAWYLKATEYTRDTTAHCAFVSTNSITQGEQTGILWPELFHRGISIDFGHRTFQWMSEARGRAHVHVVIVGFSHSDARAKNIYDYDMDEEHPTVDIVANISPYLADGGNTAITARSGPLCAAPPIVFGSMPNDGGHLLLTDDERKNLLRVHPETRPLIRPFLGSHEFINGKTRWCLWLGDANPADLRRIPAIAQRLSAVRQHRESSKRETTRELARTPSLFGEDRQPTRRYLLIPSVSSERRPYIPMGFLPPATIASNLALVIPGATPFHFGILSSTMHMAWVRHVCGRLKSDYRYSNAIVYNNFPWPADLTAAQRTRIEEAGQAVLDARAPFFASGSTLADLYDPNTMPRPLAEAHTALDRAVDRAYRPQPFPSDRHRFEFLFNLYERLTAPLTPPPKRPRRRH